MKIILDKKSMKIKFTIYGIFLLIATIITLIYKIIEK